MRGSEADARASEPLPHVADPGALDAPGPVALPCRVSLPRVLRLMGYPPEAIGRESGRWRGLGRRHRRLLDPRGTWRCFAPDDVIWPDTPGPRPERVAVGLVTIGPGLEREVARLAREGLLVESLAADAFGSAAVEAAAGSLERRVRAGARRSGFVAGARAVPGCGPVDLEFQRRVFASLGPAGLGVSLTTGVMMDPVKSVTFSIPLFAAGSTGARSKARSAAACADCDLERCTVRRAGSPDRRTEP